MPETKKAVESISYLFEPKSVAVIGASRRPEAVGHAVFKNLVNGGFKGSIYPVNPKVDQLDGYQCYPSLLDIQESVDLAMIVVPSAAVPDTLEQCGQKNVKGAVVITAGFREIGNEGIALEKKAIEVAQRYGIRFLGPNCLGLINTDPRIAINASFSRSMPEPGNIAFISQSGALCAAILDYAKGERIGFSKFVSLGNKSDISELDILRYLKTDPNTQVILIYIEDLVDGRAFIEVARDITGDIAHTKPILAIKAGRTPQGSKAASSHTGSLMGSDEVYDAIFAQAGVLRVESAEDLFDFARAFAYQPIPKGNRVAIVTNAGGPGIMATDACVRSGLNIIDLAEKTQVELKKVLPPTASVGNPIDVIGDAQHDRYEAAIKLVLDDPNVDALLTILTPQAMTDIEEIAQVVVRMAKSTSKTVLACFMGIVDVSAGVKILEDHKIPHYMFPEETARALAAMCRYREWVQRPRTTEKKFPVDGDFAKSILDSARSSGQKLLRIDQAMEVLRAYGFPMLPYEIVNSASKAVEAARTIGFPVVLKVVSSQIVHKIDVGGVKVNLKTEAEVAQAYENMIADILAHYSKEAIEGVMVQAMSEKGREVILGMNRDPHFGPTVMFGLGGTYVEVLKDVTFRLAPIRELGAKRMIERIKTYPILKGVRGEKPADLEKIAESLLRLSQLSHEQAEISEIDINPLVVYNQGEGAFVLDARMVLK